MPKSLTPLAMLGWGCWLVYGISTLPWPPTKLEWVPLLLLWGILILIPWALKLSATPIALRVLAHGAGIAAAASFVFAPSLIRGLLFIPWVIFAGLLFFRQFFRTRVSLATLASFFLLIGTAWGTAYGFGWTPLGFDPLIVLLTAVHFHFAGFLLTFLASQIVGRFQGLLNTLIWIGLAGGVPLVATGITVSHLQGPAWIEVLAVGWMAATAFLILWKYHLLIRQEQAAQVGYLGILLLGIGMTLAVLYGIRYFFPIPQLSIPWMYALHGTANASGITILWWGLRGAEKKAGKQNGLLSHYPKKTSDEKVSTRFL